MINEIRNEIFDRVVAATGNDLRLHWQGAPPDEDLPYRVFSEVSDVTWKDTAGSGGFLKIDFSCYSEDAAQAETEGKAIFEFFESAKDVLDFPNYNLAGVKNIAQRNIKHPASLSGVTGTNPVFQQVVSVQLIYEKK